MPLELRMTLARHMLHPVLRLQALQMWMHAEVLHMQNPPWRGTQRDVRLARGAEPRRAAPRRRARRRVRVQTLAPLEPRVVREPVLPRAARRRRLPLRWSPGLQQQAVQGFSD